MKLVIVIVLVFTLTANAQKTSLKADSAKTMIVPTQFTHADTVRALHNLFKTGEALAVGLSEAAHFLQPLQALEHWLIITTARIVAALFAQMQWVTL